MRRNSAHSDQPFIESLSGFPVFRQNHNDPYDFFLRDVWSRKATSITVVVKGQTLRFDIDVFKRFRGRGLYTQILERVQEDLEVASEKLKSEMENLDQLRTMSMEQITSLRTQIIESLYNTPAAKARTRNGFAHLASFTLSPERDCISFNMIKGEINSADSVRIFVVTMDGKTNELISSGQAMSADVNLAGPGPEYVRTWDPCEK